LALHEELEARLAKFFSKQAAIVFPTGFQANLGGIAGLVGKGDVVIIDRSNHACIYDGCRLSYGQTRKYDHNDMEDLRRVLTEHQGRSMLIVVDGVFSMEGDIARLPEITQLADEFGAAVMVDDAHGIGVLGKQGAGTAQHFGVEDKVDIIMGTYSKSMATIGGCLAGDADTVDYLKHNARPLIFSASLPAANTASALAALDIIENEPERRERLWANADYLRNGLKDLGFDTLKTESTVVPVFVGDDMQALQFWRKLFDGGLFVTPVIHPGVAKGSALIRTSVMASHRPEHLDRALDIFASAGKELGLTKQ
jgi:8-amino-7-oxononanoate synthase